MTEEQTGFVVDTGQGVIFDVYGPREYDSAQHQFVKRSLTDEEQQEVKRRLKEFSQTPEAKELFQTLKQLGKDGEPGIIQLTFDPSIKSTRGAKGLSAGNGIVTLAETKGILDGSLFHELVHECQNIKYPGNYIYNRYDNMYDWLKNQYVMEAEAWLKGMWFEVSHCPRGKESSLLSPSAWIMFRKKDELSRTIRDPKELKKEVFKQCFDEVVRPTLEESYQPNMIKGIQEYGGDIGKEPDSKVKDISQGILSELELDAEELAFCDLVNQSMKMLSPINDNGKSLIESSWARYQEDRKAAEKRVAQIRTQGTSSKGFSPRTIVPPLPKPKRFPSNLKRPSKDSSSPSSTPPSSPVSGFSVPEEDDDWVWNAGTKTLSAQLTGGMPAFLPPDKRWMEQHDCSWQMVQNIRLQDVGELDLSQDNPPWHADVPNIYYSFKDIDFEKSGENGVYANPAIGIENISVVDDPDNTLTLHKVMNNELIIDEDFQGTLVLRDCDFQTLNLTRAPSVKINMDMGTYNNLSDEGKRNFNAWVTQNPDKLLDTDLKRRILSQSEAAAKSSAFISPPEKVLPPDQQGIPSKEAPSVPEMPATFAQIPYTSETKV